MSSAKPSKTVPGTASPLLAWYDRHARVLPWRISPDERAHGVVARKYFSPLISDLPMYRDRPSAAAHNLPVAQRISSSILCLPMFPDLSEQDQQRVISLLHH